MRKLRICAHKSALKRTKGSEADRGRQEGSYLVICRET